MQEPTAYVFIQTVDGDIEKVEKDVALLSPFVHREVNRHGRGYSRDSPVALPKQVSPAVLKLVLEYCRFHRVSGRSDKVCLQELNKERESSQQCSLRPLARLVHLL